MSEVAAVATVAAIQVPIVYSERAFADPERLMDELWNGLDWERREGAPRREYYVNPNGRAYTYGRGAGRREYMPRPASPAIMEIWLKAEQECGCLFEVCFLNGYEDGSDQLGWHADDSPEMDPARPIAIASFGAKRQIWFRQMGGSERLELALSSGSLCSMGAGMQSTHQHRIPKAGFVCGPRVSLTFRGWTPGA
jgi:alkylated DNA repair dioxygenase AlkB